MSLLHQQFCFFSWDAELCWKKPHSKNSAYRKLQFTCSQDSLFTKDWYKIKQQIKSEYKFMIWFKKKSVSETTENPFLKKNISSEV